MKTTRNQRRILKLDNSKFTDEFISIPSTEWPPLLPGKIPLYVYRNKDFLVQVYREQGMADWRLSICRTWMGGGSWADNISWDELHLVKSAIGYGDIFAVEIYPKNCDIVNVANMRHLWLIKNPPDIGWRK